MKPAKTPQNTTAGAIQNRIRLLKGGMMSSLNSSFSASARLCAQPCQPPVSMGP